MSILISALTAAVVTLSIEWFAKPWLEVRKDRILDQRRNLRKLRELAEGGAELIVSLKEKQFHHSHPNRANQALREFRQSLTTLKYGLSKSDRKQAENLSKVSKTFPQEGGQEAWMEAFEDFLLAFALFRYSRNEFKAYQKLVEAGMIDDADA